VPVTFARRGSIALLAYLVLSRRAHARELLATLIGGDSSDDQARKHLSNVLGDIRHGIGDYLRATRQAVTFDRRRPYRVDVDDFLDARTACEYDEFLAGVSLPGAPDFEAWLLTQREELRAQFIHTLRMHMDACSTSGAWEPGIRAARRLIAVEPWFEEAHQQLMLMLMQSGQRSAAILQYSTCRRVLRAELGIEPMPETTALFERLRDGVQAAPIEDTRRPVALASRVA
jgi:DNA-binding SARP family transcriptional activator